MKKLFFSLVALMAATVSFAQNTLVATLSHGEDVSMYYGTYALRDAHEAAVSGDVINLSGGAFQATNITKAITLRGAGIDANNPTYIINDFAINISEEDTGRLSMEGTRCVNAIVISGTFNNPYFLKCQFSEFHYDYERAVVKNAMFANCKITGYFILRGTSTVQFINSYVSGFSNEWSESSGASFVNCVIMPGDGYYAESISSSQLLNSILCNTRGYSSSLPSTSAANNCVSINNNVLFESSQANSNCHHASFEEVFKNYTGEYNDAQTFELTDAAKTKYLGNDGTQVGMYGGVLPYSSTPTYPQITKMNVANKTTADGKLSVEIEVSAAQ